MANDGPTLAQARAAHNQGRLAEAVPLYREVLAREPHNADALHQLGLAMATLGQAQQALSLIGAAAELQPSNPVVQANLGGALSAAGRHLEALSCYDRAVALQPDLAAAHRGRGAVLMRLGKPEPALASFREAVRLAPTDDQAHNGLGVALELASRPEEARACFARALALNPRNVDAHHNLGLMAAAAGRHGEALASIERALALRPNDPALHGNRGIQLLALDRQAEALASFELALALAPRDATVHHNRGLALLSLGRHAEALASFDRVLALTPRKFAAHFQRAVALAALERYEESLASFDQALALDPNSADALNNRGAVLVRLFRPAEALSDLMRAVALRPDNADAYINAGIALKGLGRYQEALDNLDRALSIRPDDVTATWTKALLKLSMGEFRDGWPLYESRSRLAHAQAVQRTFATPRWTGEEPLAGKILLVYADQGLGDTLQFCRYIPVVEAMAAEVIFEVQPVLKPLLGSLGMRGTLVGRGEPLPDFDLYIPLVSLPLALRTEIDTIPGGVPYLKVDTVAVRAWGERLAALPGLKVGLNWQGNPEAEKFAALEARSFPLRAAAPLARVAGVSLVSLQKGPGAAQRSEVEFGGDIIQLTDPSHMGPEEIAAETAAIITGLDLVVTCDTALAHLAGALGARVWVVLQAVPDWRWLTERADSPWYPTMRLFRQRTPGDWAELFGRVAAELAVLARAPYRTVRGIL